MTKHRRSESVAEHDADARELMDRGELELKRREEGVGQTSQPDKSRYMCRGESWQGKEELKKQTRKADKAVPQLVSVEMTSSSQKAKGRKRAIEPNQL